MTTEEIILSSARKVFRSKGLEGARMQEIADEAGINKALLHYYFRSKEKLFEKIFIEAFADLLPAVRVSLNQVENLSQFLTFFISRYFDLITELPYLPQFILQEINRNPDLMRKVTGNNELPIAQVKMLIHRDVERGLIRPIEAEQLMVNTIALIIFPFAARPIVQSLIFDNDQAAFESFLSHRKEVITRFVLDAIKPQNSL
ncbi:MAG: helix-turn-helix domain-containing protein [Bacteroidales bacterium]|nr:helix-turn-helix domain-containing protein [Bacteroidales bacterium]